MSPSSSDTGITSFLQSVDCKVLIADDVFYARAEKLATQVEGLRLVRMIDFDPLDELKKDLKIFDFDLNKNEGLNSSIILHTSGTSGFAPKPIWHANNSFLFSPPSVSRRATLTTGLAYHVMGAIAFPLAKDCNHRKIPEVIESLKALPQVDRLLLHPILAEAIPELDKLRRLDMAQTGGGKLAESVAEKLIALGVNIRTEIGSTEVGPFPLRNEPTKEHWDTFVVTDEKQAKWEHIEGNQYELLIHDPPTLGLDIGVPRGGICHTNDVFEENPAKSGK
ncbi:hypothetical protein Unana1_03399 [Umbelopsis nana]